MPNFNSLHLLSIGMVMIFSSTKANAFLDTMLDPHNKSSSSTTVPGTFDTSKDDRKGGGGGSGSDFWFPPMDLPRPGAMPSQPYVLEISYLQKPSDQWLLSIDGDLSIIPDEEEPLPLVHIQRINADGSTVEKTHSWKILKEAEPEDFNSLSFWNRWIATSYLKIKLAYVNPKIIAQWIKQHIINSTGKPDDTEKNDKKIINGGPQDTDENKEQSTKQTGSRITSTTPTSLGTQGNSETPEHESQMHRNDFDDEITPPHKQQETLSGHASDNLTDLLEKLKTMNITIDRWHENTSALQYGQDFFNEKKQNGFVLILEPKPHSAHRFSLYQITDQGIYLQTNLVTSVDFMALEWVVNNFQNLIMLVKHNHSLGFMQHHVFEENIVKKHEIIKTKIQLAQDKSQLYPIEFESQFFKKNLMAYITTFIDHGLLTINNKESNETVSISKNLSELIELYLLNNHQLIEHTYLTGKINLEYLLSFSIYLSQKRRDYKISEIPIPKNDKILIIAILLDIHNYVKRSQTEFTHFLKALFSTPSFHNQLAVYGGWAVKAYTASQPDNKGVSEYPYTVNDIDIAIKDLDTFHEFRKTFEQHAMLHFPSLRVQTQPLEMNNGITTIKYHLTMVNEWSLWKRFTIDVSYAQQEGVFNFNGIQNMPAIWLPEDDLSLPVISKAVIFKKLQEEAANNLGDDAQRRAEKAKYGLGLLAPVEINLTVLYSDPTLLDQSEREAVPNKDPSDQLRPEATTEAIDKVLNPEATGKFTQGATGGVSNSGKTAKPSTPYQSTRERKKARKKRNKGKQKNNLPVPKNKGDCKPIPDKVALPAKTQPLHRSPDHNVTENTPNSSDPINQPATQTVARASSKPSLETHVNTATEKGKYGQKPTQTVSTGKAVDLSRNVPKRKSKKQSLKGWNAHLKQASSVSEETNLRKYTPLLSVSVQGKAYLRQALVKMGLNLEKTPEIIDVDNISDDAMAHLTQAAFLYEPVANYLLSYINRGKPGLEGLEVYGQLLYAALFIPQARHVVVHKKASPDLESFDIDGIYNLYSKNDMYEMIDLPFSVRGFDDHIPEWVLPLDDALLALFKDIPEKEVAEGQLRIAGSKDMHKMFKAILIEKTALKECHDGLESTLSHDELTPRTRLACRLNFLYGTTLEKTLIEESNIDISRALSTSCFVYNPIFLTKWFRALDHLRRSYEELNSSTQDASPSVFPLFKTNVKKINKLDQITHLIGRYTALFGSDTKARLSVLEKTQGLTHLQKRWLFGRIAELSLENDSEILNSFIENNSDIAGYWSWVPHGKAIKIRHPSNLGYLIPDDATQDASSERHFDQRKSQELAFFIILEKLGFHYEVINGDVKISFNRKMLKEKEALYLKTLLLLVRNKHDQLYELFEHGFNDTSHLLTLEMMLMGVNIPFDNFKCLPFVYIHSRDHLKHAFKALLSPNSIFFDPLAFLAIVSKFFRDKDPMENHPISFDFYISNDSEIREKALNILETDFNSPKKNPDFKTFIKRNPSAGSEYYVLMELLHVDIPTNDGESRRKKINWKKTMTALKIPLLIKETPEQYDERFVTEGEKLFVKLASGKIQTFNSDIFSLNHAQQLEKSQKIIDNIMLQTSNIEINFAGISDAEKALGRTALKYYFIFLFNNPESLKKLLVLLCEIYKLPDLKKSSVNALDFLIHSGPFLFNEDITYNLIYKELVKLSPNLAQHVIKTLARWNPKHQLSAVIMDQKNHLNDGREPLTFLSFFHRIVSGIDLKTDTGKQKLIFSKFYRALQLDKLAKLKEDEPVSEPKSQRNAISKIIPMLRVIYEMHKVGLHGEAAKEETIRRDILNQMLSYNDPLGWKILLTDRYDTPREISLADRYQYLYPLAATTTNGWVTLLDSTDLVYCDWDELHKILHIYDVFSHNFSDYPDIDASEEVASNLHLFTSAMNLHSTSGDKLYSVDPAEPVNRLALRIRALYSVIHGTQEQQNAIECSEPCLHHQQTLSQIKKLLNEHNGFIDAFIQIQKDPASTDFESSPLAVREKSLLTSLQLAISKAEDMEPVARRLVETQKTALGSSSLNEEALGTSLSWLPFIAENSSATGYLLMILQGLEPDRGQLAITAFEKAQLYYWTVRDGTE